MPERDPAHWLYRLTPSEWLAAAETEQRHCREALERRSTRTAVTHARRAGGMALNAWLWSQDRPSYGRSYMEHLVALAKDPEIPADVKEAARCLVEVKPAAPPLVTIGRPGQVDLTVWQAAEKVVAFVRTLGAGAGPG